MNTQTAAAKIIDKVTSQKKSLGEILNIYLAKQSSPLDRALLQELSYGTLRWYHKLDAITKLLLHNTTKKVDPLIYALILVGLYQLIYLRIPHYATLSETVEATRWLKKPWASALVNAILRNFIRKQKEILKQIEDSNNTTQYSHPAWLIKLLQKSWPQNWQEILAANNEYPPMHLRVNLQKISRNDYLEELKKAEIEAKAVPELTAAITLEKPCDVLKLPDFQNGFVSVQDIAAQYAINLLELKPKLRVLDACAAPGGKTAHILESEPNLQELVAVDIEDARLKTAKANLNRLQLSAKFVCGDAGKPQSWWDGKKFDRILLDAPCSGTGVIRRHPDIKILRKPQDIANNAARQLELLKALWPLLADGGLLVYATCSILPEENFLVIKNFLQQHNNAKEKPITMDCGTKVMYGRQLFPTTNGSDGFYYAVITK
ncbi:Ribosomal RNA small subunit methyltransferase B [Gammaproteobacteria bacterium]